MSPVRSHPLTVVHVITDLDIGGAELMLTRLVDALSRFDVHNVVVSLKSDGALVRVLEERGTRVFTLNMRSGRVNVKSFIRLVHLLRRLRPAVLQTWLYHADLIGLLAGRAARVPSIIWNIRCASLGPSAQGVTAPWLLQTLARASRWPAAVIFNSEAGSHVHARLGYGPKRWEVIPNGFDLNTFKPCLNARRAIRQELGIGETQPLVGLLARLHPMKDHDTFLSAAARVHAVNPQVMFVLAGRDVEGPVLRQHVERLGLTAAVHLLPERSDPERLLAALDVAVLSSWSEGFPNVVGEAMACGIPVVSTDVGDAAALLGNAGRVTPPRDSEALAGAILEIVTMPAPERDQLGRMGRDRIARDFSIDAVALRYHALYMELAGAHLGTTAPRSSACVG